MLSGKDLFQLYDTYGFPFELTKEMIEAKNFKVDEEGFKKAQAEAVELARQTGKGPAPRMCTAIASGRKS